MNRNEYKMRLINEKKRKVLPTIIVIKTSLSQIKTEIHSYQIRFNRMVYNLDIWLVDDALFLCLESFAFFDFQVDENPIYFFPFSY